MKKSLCAAVLAVAAGGMIGFLAAQTKPAPGPASDAPAKKAAKGGFTGPSRSVRPPDQMLERTEAATLLGWRVGARTDAFGPLTFSEAAARADGAGLAYVEGVSAQKVSAEIPRNLDYNLTPADVEKVKARLNELRLRMPAYYAGVVPADPASQRKLFEFAHNIGADMIVGAAEPPTLPGLDKLANEFAINVALVNPAAAAAPAVDRLSGRIGFHVNLGAWMQAGLAPLAGLARIKNRLFAATLTDRSSLGATGSAVELGAGVGDLKGFLLQLSRLQPPNSPVDYPLPPGKDGSGQKAEVKPIFFDLDARGARDVSTYLAREAAAYDAAVLPAIEYRVDALARLTPISTPDQVPADEKQRIAAAIPRHALAAPKKPRKLLVLDLAFNGAFYHASAPLGNLSLQLMSDYTGAFTPVFSNDLDNLKYPKIKDYDAVFLNQVIGDVFADREALEGLMRFVREGGGVAGLHAATWASQNVPEYGEMMGATSGAHKYNGEPGGLRIDDPNSPLTRQFGGKPFEFVDEFYHYLPTGPYSRKKVHVLLSLDPARKDLPGNRYANRPDNDYGMVWIKSYGKGRVFNCGLGHRPEFYETPNMQQMIFAATQFILGDLTADTTPGNQPVK